MRNGIIINCNNQEEKLNIYNFEIFLDNNPTDILCFLSDNNDVERHLRLLDFKYIQKERVLVVELDKNADSTVAVAVAERALVERMDVHAIKYCDNGAAPSSSIHIMRPEEINLSHRIAMAS